MIAFAQPLAARSALFLNDQSSQEVPSVKGVSFLLASSELVLELDIVKKILAEMLRKLVIRSLK